MADIAADFAVETSSTTGTGTFSLDGAVSGFRTLVAALGTGVTGEFVARTATYSKWERFRGVITDGSPDTLTRAEILESSNSDAAVDWQAGDLPIYIHCITSARRFSQLRARHRSATAPENPLQASMVWVDISGGVTAVVEKYYDGADWIAYPWVINETANTITFAAASVTNAMLADMTAATFKGRISGTGAPQDLTDQQAASLLYVGAKFITGMTYANNGSDATNDIDIAAGVCHADDASYAYWIELAAITKRLDASWAVGTNQGGLDTGSIANTDYYIWAIARSDTGVTDVLFSTSSTSPTMPANYDYKRLIGWFKRVSSAIVAFTTLELPGGGLLFKWATPSLEKDVTNLSTSRITDAAKVPLNFRTRALLRTMIASATGGTMAIVCDPGEADAAPSLSATPLCTHYVPGNNLSDVKDQWIWTSATGTVAARASAASTSYRFSTLGFEWSRR